jgi:hypothetical protein
MHRSLLRITIAAALAAAALAGCMGGGSSGERPAPPGPLTVSSTSGARFTGPPARIDVRHATPGAPTVELLMSAADDRGRTWALQAALPAESLTSLTLRAQLVQRPLQPGDATVQLTAPPASAAPQNGAVTASAGQLQARLQHGRIEGSVTGTTPDLSATFAGPFAVTCAVPSQPGSTTLVVDEQLESPACKPYADLTRRH